MVKAHCKGEWSVCRVTRFSTLWRFSLLVDVDHPESSSLVLLSLILHSEDHNFVAWEAIALLLSHLEYQRDKLLHVLLEIPRYFIAKDASGAIDLSDYTAELTAGEYELLGLLAHKVPCHTPSARQTYQQVHIVVQGNLSRR